MLACTAQAPNSGNNTDSSMPYMCCGGTVATTCSGREKSSAPRATAFFAVLVQKSPHRFGLALGAPVEPEV